jgi:hypothetical protein
MAQHRPMNVHVAPNTGAARVYEALRGIPGGAEAIAPGVRPTPAHDLIFHGGRTIASLTFQNFYLGGQAAWDASDIQQIDHALAAAMSDRGLNNVMAQYFSGSITSTFVGSTVLAGAPPRRVNQTDVENLVTTLHGRGQFQGQDLTSTVFNFLLPRGAILSDDSATSAHQQMRHPHGVPDDEDNQADSQHGLGGYHGSVHVGQDTIYYAIGVFSAVDANGHANGIPVFDQPWKNVVATFYHELNEARTDADVEDAIRAGNDPQAVKFLGWTSREGEECGDFPVFEANPLTKVFKEIPLADGSGSVPVQFQYSNAAHGPEGPLASPAHPAHA